VGNFDQRNQVVNNQTIVAGDQYNAGRDIVHNEGIAAIADELKTLIGQLQDAARSGDLDPDIAFDAECELKKAAREVEKEEPDKSRLLDFVNNAQKLLADVVNISKSAAIIGLALGVAAAKIMGVFQ
jgi:hypothetical protein